MTGIDDTQKTIQQWKKANREAIEQEEVKMAVVVSKMLGAWAELEHEHCLLLDSALFGLNAHHLDPPEFSVDRSKSTSSAKSAAAIIYFTPASADVRFKTVDEVLKNKFAQLGGIFSVEVPRCWKKIASKRDDKRKLRNDVAHGMTTTFDQNGKPTARLTTEPSNPKGVIGNTGSLPGLTADDIIRSAISINEITKLVRAVHYLLHIHLTKVPSVIMVSGLVSLMQQLGMFSAPGANSGQSTAASRRKPRMK